MQQLLHRLSTGATVSVNDHRVRVDIDIADSHACHRCCGYQSISSATLHGGTHTFINHSNNYDESNKTAHVINYRVPDTYDGLHPPPLQLLENFVKIERQIVGGNNMLENTVGLLTAASMKTMAMASRSSSSANGRKGRRGIHVDAIVTAGLSNSRSIGADADYFYFGTESRNSGSGSRGDDEASNSSSQHRHLIGTINTIVIVSGAPLTPAAQIEAYAIAIEAKCASCVNLGVLCAKDPTNYSMGTGTDCCVLLSPCILPTKTTSRCSCAGGGEEERVIKHSGKHTLFAEMIGQAVQEATTEAIMINIRHLHYNYATYTLRRWIRIFLAGIMKGARPSYIPQNPMMPVPGPPYSATLLGLCFVFIIYLIPFNEGGNLLLAAVIWDRFLGEPPLRVHPVCLVGSLISLGLSTNTLSNPRIYTNSVLGFTCGLALLISMLVVFLYGAWKYIQLADAIFLMARSIYNDHGMQGHSTILPILLWMMKHALEMTSWILKLLLLKSTFSLQLLCTVALQMAHYLERDQIDEARIQLAWLCSRDASTLGSSDLAGATLESLSENLSDGFIAPIFWYVLMGPLGALAYRIINTLDSRIGYRGKYECFGKASARLDDLVNFAPARLTALLLALAAGPVQGWTSSWTGLRTAWKDVEQCDSPNAGWPMACFAGILGVRLKKEGAYCLGADGRNPGSVDIRDGHKVAQIAGGISIIIGIVISSINKH